VTVRIAMWSGPRNLSTAMMRAFENRPDCAVSDEPFYAAYLAETGLDHPMRAEVLAAQPTDWREVASMLVGPAPDNAPLWYQKHMTHHMLPGFGREWIGRCRNAFLIRHPAAVLASYVAKRETVSLDDIGVVQQAELFDREADRLGKVPPVIDAADVLADPAGTLGALCVALEIAFDPAMLDWPAGRRSSDGVWAPAWYAAVEASTGFAAPAREQAQAKLPDHLSAIAAAAEADYLRLAAHKLSP
jgi:Sulfotransferase domain